MITKISPIYPILVISIVLALSSTIVASTEFSPNPSSCEILGDDNVYGLGIRLSLYIQWAALLIFLMFSPQNADIARTAQAVTTSAVYISALRNAQNGSFLAINWPILWNMTFSLTMYNWPVCEIGFKKNGATMALILLLWTIYYVTSPWVFFKGLDIAKKPGCDIKYFIFAPVSVYAHGFRIAFKVFSILGAIIFGIIGTSGQ